MARSENSFFEAIEPTPSWVLGLKLLPFSLGHYFTLRRHGCAFVAPEATKATASDLMLACLVCSMPFGEFDKWLAPRRKSWRQISRAIRLLLLGKISLGRFVTAMRGSACDFDLLWWGKRVGEFDIAEKVGLFNRYLSEHSTIPKYWIDKESGKESGAHWSHVVFTTLTSKIGFSREEALSIPLREALIHFFQYAETIGAASLMTDEQIEEIETAEAAWTSKSSSN